MNRYTIETKQLDYSHPRIKRLIEERGWPEMEVRERIRSIYDYVRDEIRFGYNRADEIPASEVLADGYGQCNTKGVLFMALLRSVGIECRMHGFTIRKELQKGAMRGWYYRLAPQEILHSWVEIRYGERWLNIEGFILDLPYLSRLQRKFADCAGSFCGYGVATDDFRNPSVYWNEGDTYVQKEGIARDFGVFDQPDDFFARHRQSLGPLREQIYKRVVRHLMNRNVTRIREGE